MLIMGHGISVQFSLMTYNIDYQKSMMTLTYRQTTEPSGHPIRNLLLIIPLNSSPDSLFIEMPSSDRSETIAQCFWHGVYVRSIDTVI